MDESPAPERLSRVTRRRRRSAMTEPCSRTCCASSRRRSSARSCAGTGSSTPARTPSRRRCSRRRVQWPARASPTGPAAWLLTVAARRAGRPLAQRQRPPAPRGGRRAGPADPAQAAGPARPRHGCRRRHADAAVPVLPPGAVAAVAARADPARGRRPDHRARSPPRSWCPEATMAQRISRAKQTHPRRRGPVRAAAAGGAAGAARRRPARALPDLQRGLHRQLRTGPAPHRPHHRGDPAHPAAAPRCCPATARSPGCSR